MKRALLMMALLAGLCAGLQAQTYTTVIGSNLTDLNGNKLAQGTICFLGTDQADQPVNFALNGGGQVLRRPSCFTVTNGVIQSGAQIPNPATTSPSGILYRITVTDTQTRQVVLVYNRVSLQGSSWNFDSYQPLGVPVPAPPNPANVTGPLNVAGDISVTGSSELGAVTATGIVSKSIEQIRYADQYGASPANSAAANTSALQSWLNSGATRLYLPDGTYTTNELTLPSGVEIFGPGTLKQAAVAHEVFYCAACSNVWIHGITLEGAGGNGVSPAPSNDDCGIKVANPAASATVANIRIDHVTFVGWLLYGAWLQNAKDVWFDHNYFYNSGPLVRLEGVTEAHVTDNIARDTSIDPSVFKSAISLPGTTAGYATDQHVIVAHNTIANYSNTQAVLIHSCTDCTVADNHFIGVNQGVGAAPATAADTIVRLQVAHNTYESTSTAGSSPGNQCIFVAGNATTSADHPVISGNTCYDANLVDQSSGEGAIGLSYTDGAIVEGNSLSHSYVSGIYVNNVNTNLHIGSNLVANGQAVGGLNEGIYLPSGQGSGTTGTIIHNTFVTYLDGLRFDTAATGLVVGENTFTGVTGARIVSPSNATVATTSYGTVNAQLQSDVYPSVVLDGPNRELCLGPGSIACDVTLSRGAGGTASFNERVDALSLNINGTGVLSTTAQTGTGSIVMSSSPSITSSTITGGTVDLTSGTLKQPASYTANGVAIANPSTAGTLALTSQFPLFATLSAWSPGAIAGGACVTTTQGVANATTSMAVAVSPLADPGSGLMWSGWVSAAGTVSVRLCNTTAASITPNAESYNVRVIQ